MSSKALEYSSTPLTGKQFVSMRTKLKKLGFGSMREVAKGTALNLSVPPDFPAPNREVMSKSAGKSIARFVFSKSDGLWNLELTFSRPTDERTGILVEAFPGKKHAVNNRTYEATIVPIFDEEKAVAEIDDLNVFLAGLDSDKEISEAIDARIIKKRLRKMGEQLTGENSMVADFINYIAGFITHCDELWAWQVQRLKMDRHAKEVMGKIANKV